MKPYHVVSMSRPKRSTCRPIAWNSDSAHCTHIVCAHHQRFGKCGEAADGRQTKTTQRRFHYAAADNRSRARADQRKSLVEDQADEWYKIGLAVGGLAARRKMAAQIPSRSARDSLPRRTGSGRTVLDCLPSPPTGKSIPRHARHRQCAWRDPTGSPNNRARFSPGADSISTSSDENADGGHVRLSKISYRKYGATAVIRPAP